MSGCLDSHESTLGSSKEFDLKISEPSSAEKKIPIETYSRKEIAKFPPFDSTISNNTEIFGDYREIRDVNKRYANLIVSKEKVSGQVPNSV